jgi:hypothetical protein
MIMIPGTTASSWYRHYEHNTKHRPPCKPSMPTHALVAHDGAGEWSLLSLKLMHRVHAQEVLRGHGDPSPKPFWRLQPGGHGPARAQAACASTSKPEVSLSGVGKGGLYNGNRSSGPPEARRPKLCGGARQDTNINVPPTDVPTACAPRQRGVQGSESQTGSLKGGVD